MKKARPEFFFETTRFSRERPTSPAGLRVCCIALERQARVSDGASDRQAPLHLLSQISLATMATMEQAIKRSLGMRSTLYKNIEPSLLSSLAVLAERHVLDGKGLAAAFDKFMTVSR